MQIRDSFHKSFVKTIYFGQKPIYSVKISIFDFLHVILYFVYSWYETCIGPINDKITGPFFFNNFLS